MKTTDTPETDNLARGNHVVPTEWAEQLERQLRKVRDTVHRLRKQRAIARAFGEQMKRELDEAIRQRNETNESSKYAVQYAERERDEARKSYLKLVDLAHRMLAEMEYVDWLSTAAVFRDELNQIKEEIK